MDNLESVTEAEAFLRAEEAVEQCMALNGFPYEKRAYVDTGRRGDRAQLRADILLGGSEEWGYRGTFLALSSLLAPTGAPPRDLSPSELEAYDRALLDGVSFHTHEAGDEPHQHGDGEAHTHDSAGSGAGCQRQGELVFEAQQIRADDGFDERADEKINEAFARLASVPEYLEFETRWLECLEGEGVVVDISEVQAQGFSGSRLTAHTVGRQLDYARRAGAIASAFDISDVPSVLDLAWLEQVTGEADELGSLFADEVAEAAIDRECRIAHSELLEERIEEIADLVGLAAS